MKNINEVINNLPIVIYDLNILDHFSKKYVTIQLLNVSFGEEGEL